MITTDAWVLHVGPDSDSSAPPRAELSREAYSFPALEDGEVLIEPLYGSWEANLEHALSRSPVDICRQRGENTIVPGNSGVVRVLRTTSANSTLAEGDLCLFLPFGARDRHGYAELVHAYDAPDTIGILARQTKIRAENLLPLPKDTPYSLQRWAAAERYFTAWDSWRIALTCWRAQMGDADPAEYLVFGWGGAVSLGVLELARRAGFRVAMTTSTDQRLALLKERGISPVDRRQFPDLNHTPAVAKDPERMRRYRESEKEFLRQVAELSDGAGVAVFVDNIGAPLQRATLKAMARQGVLATVGWKHGMKMYNLRAIECINRHIHVNTHMWRHGDSPEIRDYQESTGWIPEIEPEAVYDFDDIPKLAEDYAQGRVDTYFPVYAVNPE